MPSTLTAVAATHGASTSPGTDRAHLAPEDAYHKSSSAGSSLSGRKRRERARSANRRQKGHYKKLLWFRQPFPDNYTDEKTFLDHLQRNPRLQPYEFWSLMIDSTVIVQHVASVVIFCCCFAAIFQDRVSPLSVVSWASFCTFLAWVLWDYWMGQEEAETARKVENDMDIHEEDTGDSSTSSTIESHGLGLSLTQGDTSKPARSQNASATSITSNVSNTSNSGGLAFVSSSDAPANHPPYIDPTSSLSPRNQQRVATAKSAMLIYAALLGLSPILKSLTKSTTSDSIWALSTWLLCMNVAFFDYSSPAGSHLPASISTNSALMASTVLASRLPSTTHVFSLTLFSIEVFGLFPIFRRQLRAASWTGNLVLTVILVTTASGALFATLTGGGRGAWIAGVILGSALTILCMGICCWWLIGLQKYKNEMHGPWDPARPIIRRRWD